MVMGDGGRGIVQSPPPHRGDPGYGVRVFGTVVLGPGAQALIETAYGLQGLAPKREVRTMHLSWGNVGLRRELHAVVG